MKYANPGHPAAPLYPQEGGFLLGGGGFEQNRDDTRVVRPKMRVPQTPVSERKLLNAGGGFGRSINPGRMINDEGDKVEL